MNLFFTLRRSARDKCNANDDYSDRISLTSRTCSRTQSNPRSASRFPRLASKVCERVFRLTSSRESAFSVFSRQECFEYVVETSVFEQKVDRLSVDGAKGRGVRERPGEPGVDEQRHAPSVSNRSDVFLRRQTQSFPHDSHRDVNVHPSQPRLGLRRRRREAISISSPTTGRATRRFHPRTLRARAPLPRRSRATPRRTSLRATARAERGAFSTANP